MMKYDTDISIHTPKQSYDIHFSIIFLSLMLSVHISCHLSVHVPSKPFTPHTYVHTHAKIAELVSPVIQ